jgi:hypothetical protein
MKFLIFGLPYRNSSAGIRVLYRLARELINLGYNAFVFTDWAETAQLRSHVGDCIVVYPEIICGNPVGAKNVVRYVLNTPGNNGAGDTFYSDSELVFVYNRQLMAPAQAATSQVIDDSRLLEISVIEPWLFRSNPEVKKVHDVALWIGKGYAKAQKNLDKINAYLEGKNVVQITYDTPSTREGLALLFQSCHEFLTTDDFTAMIAEAMLCDCKVMVMKDDKPVEFIGDASPWRTKYYDISPIQNFVNICRETFERTSNYPASAGISMAGTLQIA